MFRPNTQIHTHTYTSHIIHTSHTIYFSDDLHLWIIYSVALRFLCALYTFILIFLHTSFFCLHRMLTRHGFEKCIYIVLFVCSSCLSIAFHNLIFKWLFLLLFSVAIFIVVVVAFVLCFFFPIDSTVKFMTDSYTFV